MLEKSLKATNSEFFSMYSHKTHRIHRKRNIRIAVACQNNVSIRTGICMDSRMRTYSEPSVKNKLYIHVINYYSIELIFFYCSIVIILLFDSITMIPSKRSLGAAMELQIPIVYCVSALLIKNS